MQVKFKFIPVILATLSTFTLSTRVGLSQPGYRNRVSFYCQTIQNAPTTVAQVPRRYDAVRIIRWKYMEGKINQQRCEEVSDKFQEFYDRGKLNYVTHGQVNGYSVICAVANMGEQCNGSNQLFTLINNNNPDLVLRKLMGMLEGNVGTFIIEENGGEEQVYISMDKILNDKLMRDTNEN